MDGNPTLLRFVIAGQLRRDFILPPEGKTYMDQPGGNLLYAAAGLGLWETHAGLAARIGEDFPQAWLGLAQTHGFDTRGVHIEQQALDLRRFIAYTAIDACHMDNPISHFSRLDMAFPRALLGYANPEPVVDSRSLPLPYTIYPSNFPADYMNATAAHICPLDYMSHQILPAAFNKGRISTLTLDPSPGYMNAALWAEAKTIFKGLTAVHCSEKKMRTLFKGRSADLWEMAEEVAAQQVEFVIIKRGSLGQLLFINASRQRWSIPAYPSKPIDPTGAGDAFCGGFLANYRNSYDPLQAVLHGNISASLTIEGSGPFYALNALPGLAAARLASVRAMARKV